MKIRNCFPVKTFLKAMAVITIQVTDQEIAIVAGKYHYNEMKD